MTYFTIVTQKEPDTETHLDFQAVEFGIANAVFQALSSRSDTSDVLLYAIGEGEVRTLVCNKKEWQAAQAEMRRQQMTQRGLIA